MTGRPRLVYIADPMCSWCWGFAPVIESLNETFGERTPVAVLLGGLAPGARGPMHPNDKAAVRSHWDHVREATAQPFDFGFFEREEFVYDTEPACRAVVASRRLDAGRTLAFLGHLQQAFYRDNRDVTDPATLCDVAADFGFDRSGFSEELEGDGARREARDDFVLARQLGISGFPSLVGYDGDRLTKISSGYRPIEKLTGRIALWLESASPDAADGPAGTS